MAEAPTPRVEGAASTLVCAPGGSGAETDACVELGGADAPGEALLLAIAYGTSPEDCLAPWRERALVAPKDGRCVAVGEGRRGAADGVAIPPVADELPVAVDVVPDPADLAGLGRRVTETLDDWDGLDGRVVCCVRTAEALVAEVGLERAFRFLGLLAAQVDAVGGTVHVHADPAAMDATALGTLRTLFDAVATAGPDGGWTVEERGTR